MKTHTLYTSTILYTIWLCFMLYLFHSLHLYLRLSLSSSLFLLQFDSILFLFSSCALKRTCMICIDTPHHIIFHPAAPANPLRTMGFHVFWKKDEAKNRGLLLNWFFFVHKKHDEGKSFSFSNNRVINEGSKKKAKIREKK